MQNSCHVKMIISSTFHTSQTVFVGKTIVILSLKDKARVVVLYKEDNGVNL